MRMDENLKTKVVLGTAVAGAVGCLGFYMYTYTKNRKDYKRVATVEKLFLHPVKSLSAIEVEEGEITGRGFKSNGIYDRSFMIIDQNDRFVTARRFPKMMLIKPSFSYDKKHLVLTVEGKEDLYIPLDVQGEVIESRVWGNPVKGIDCGEDAAEWFSDYLGGTYRMVFYSARLPGAQLAKVFLFYAHMKSNEVALYQDCGQFHLLSAASIDDLNTRMEQPTSVVNFRPNIFVKDCSAYAEDFWKYVKIGERAELRFTHFCFRCKMIGLDHDTGSYTSSFDPLKILRGYRQVYSFVEDRENYMKNPIFGINLNMEKRGVVRVGDPIYATYKYQEHAGNKLT